MGDPRLELTVEGAEAEEEVLLLAPIRRGAADLAAGAEQVGGVEGAAAVVTLVAAGAVIAAVRADTLHVAVGQEALVLGAVGQEHRVLVDMSALQ